MILNFCLISVIEIYILSYSNDLQWLYVPKLRACRIHDVLWEKYPSLSIMHKTYMRSRWSGQSGTAFPWFVSVKNVIVLYLRDDSLIIYDSAILFEKQFVINNQLKLNSNSKIWACLKIHLICCHY